MFSTYVEPLQDKPGSGGAPSQPDYDDVEEKDDKSYNDDYDDYKKDPNANNNKKMTAEAFLSVRLEDLFDEGDENYDIAKKICFYYDEQFGNKNTVCMVSDIGKKPAMSYWVDGDYVRKHDDIYGKRIIVYKACKHQPANKPIVSHDEFVDFVKKLSIENENESVNTICDLLDKEFGDGCHYCRSDIENAHYDIYCRYNDEYEAAFKLPSGAYVISWRR
eukprot:75956_1